MHAFVFAKGVPAIEHQLSDAYYRCLLRQDRQEVLKTIADMGVGASDAWFRTRLAGHAEHGAAELPRLGDAAEPAPPGRDAQLGLLVPVVPASEWQRAWVSMGAGSPWIKVWFDHCEQARGHMRGFANCESHGCVKYKPTFSPARHFMAAMYLWHRQAADAGVAMDCQGHLAFWPSDAEIEAAEPSIELQPF